ncbi:MAG: STAS domain-containing protein [Kiritimatiellae bacterium]|jgi:anti-anti-sigma factor|nr:STAS domain-containing protein [Kiritimatiellia bacterium]MDY0149615.1 STAS domain-containing protein [Kiritimatiellia bacterium]
MPKSTLSLTSEDCNGVRLIHVSGPLDSMTIDQFKAYMDPLLNEARVRIVLDCQDLSYVNSRGLMLLVRYQRAVRQAFSFLGISGLNSRTLKGIKLLGMEQLLCWHPTVEEAMAVAEAL